MEVRLGLQPVCPGTNVRGPSEYSASSSHSCQFGRPSPQYARASAIASSRVRLLDSQADRIAGIESEFPT
jgi:hypothetical protein